MHNDDFSGSRVSGTEVHALVRPLALPEEFGGRTGSTALKTPFRVCCPQSSSNPKSSSLEKKKGQTSVPIQVQRRHRSPRLYETICRPRVVLYVNRWYNVFVRASVVKTPPPYPARHGEQVVVDGFRGRVADRLGSRRDNVARSTGAAAAGGACVRVDRSIASRT